MPSRDEWGEALVMASLLIGRVRDDAFFRWLSTTSLSKRRLRCLGRIACVSSSESIV